MITFNEEEAKVILYALTNATLNNFRGEFIVPLSSVLHRLHASLMKNQQINSPQQSSKQVSSSEQMPSPPAY